MISRDQLAEFCRFGYVEYRAANPWSIVLTTAWPRALLQCLFFTLLGQAAAGEAGSRFAFVGSVGMIIMLTAVIGVSDVPMIEKWQGTFSRLRLSGIPVVAVFGIRALPWIIESLAAVVLCLLVVGPLTGNGDISLALVPTLPLFALMAVSCVAAGLAVASPAVGKRADALLTNGLVYLVIATGGLLVPPGRAPVLDAIGSVLPLRHGVLAVRAVLDGRPWLPEAAMEAAVAVCWGLAAAVLYRRQVKRAAAKGLDDFA